MATAGYSGTPLARKLGIKEGHRVGLLRPPDHFEGLVAPLPRGVRLRQFRRGGPPYDVIVLFAVDRRALALLMPRAVEALSWSGGLWVAWPKRSSALAGDLGEAHVRSTGLSTGLVDNKICAIDLDWSGLRFVYRVVDRPGD